MRVPKRLTERVLRGLDTLVRLGVADVECSEPDDFTKAQRQEVLVAAAWVKQQLAQREKRGKRGRDEA